MMAAAAATGCGGGDDDDNNNNTSGPDTVDNLLGDTALVAIINPVVNTGHTTGVPSITGTERNAIPVEANPGDAAVSENGIAVVGTGTGAVEVTVGNAMLGHNVLVAGDVYDAPIAFDGTTAEFYPNTPVRYPIGAASGAVLFGPADALADVQAKLGLDNTVVVLRGGTYTGDITIDGTGTMLYGLDFLNNAVMINGSVTVNGAQVRLRGVTVTGDLTVKGNDFGISFSTVEGNTSINGNAGAFVRNVFCGTTVVPTSNATLLDNFGLEPITTIPAGACN
jgi:hypothetical protein